MARGGERLADVEAAVHAQQVVDRDGAARVLRVGPGGDRRGPFERKLALLRQDADQGVGHGLGGRPAHDLRVDAVARRIALGDHPAVAHHDHGLGVAIGRCARSQRRRDRARALGRPAGLDDLRAGNAGSSGRARACAASARRRGRLVVQHQAAQRAAVDGAGLGDAGEAGRHLGALRGRPGGSTGSSTGDRMGAIDSR